MVGNGLIKLAQTGAKEYKKAEQEEIDVLNNLEGIVDEGKDKTSESKDDTCKVCDGQITTWKCQSTNIKVYWHFVTEPEHNNRSVHVLDAVCNECGALLERPSAHAGCSGDNCYKAPQALWRNDLANLQAKWTGRKCERLRTRRNMSSL